MTQLHFIEPVDVLSLRGNRSFGEPGSYGESMLPPWPSVAAGALRSLLFAQTRTLLDDPDEFRLTDFRLARAAADRDEAIYPLPADLALSGSHAAPVLRRLQPTPPADGLESSAALGMWPVLAEAERGKPLSGYWLSEAGWKRHLDGDLPEVGDLIASDALWQMETRIGVGLDALAHRAADGQLFSLQAVAFNPGVGFMAASDGRTLMPQIGTLRLGGDGHAALLRPARCSLPQADHAGIAGAGRARIILTAPGLFPDGWRLPGMQPDGQWALGDLRGRIVAACVPRAEVVSGWDLDKKRPKPAMRAVPTGSVYWIEDLEATAPALDKLATHGLWPENPQDQSRRIEGYNRFAFAAF